MSLSPRLKCVEITGDGPTLKLQILSEIVLVHFRILYFNEGHWNAFEMY